MTFDEAKTLKIGDIFHVLGENKRDGKPQNWRVTGKTKLWKTNPNRIKIPCAHGMYEHGYIETDNLHLVYLPKGK